MDNFRTASLQFVHSLKESSGVPSRRLPPCWLFHAVLLELAPVTRPGKKAFAKQLRLSQSTVGARWNIRHSPKHTKREAKVLHYVAFLPAQLHSSAASPCR